MFNIKRTGDDCGFNTCYGCIFNTIGFCREQIIMKHGKKEQRPKAKRASKTN